MSAPDLTGLVLQSEALLVQAELTQQWHADRMAVELNAGGKGFLLDGR